MFEFNDCELTTIKLIKILVKAVREADYVVIAMDKIRNDLGQFSTPLDFGTVVNYLQRRWDIIYLKLRLSFSNSLYDLEMKMAGSATNLVSHRLNKLIPKHGSKDVNFEDSTALKTLNLSYKRLDCFSPSLFADLSEKDRKTVGERIVEIEEAFEEYTADIAFANDNNAEAVLNIQTQYLSTLLRLILMRTELRRIVLKGEPLAVCIFYPHPII